MITDKSCTMLIKHLLTHLMAIKTNKLKYIHSFSKKEIPKQRNDYDCGMLVCMFAEHLSRGEVPNFNQSIST